MKFTSLTAKALLAVAIAVPALPAAANTNSSASAEAGATASAAKAEEAKICRKVDQTGSRTRSKKVCLTSEQWKKMDDQEI